MPQCGQASLLASRVGVAVESQGPGSVGWAVEDVRAGVEVDEEVAQVAEAPGRTIRTLLARTTKAPSPMGHNNSKRFRRVFHRLSRALLPMLTMRHPLLHPNL